MVVESPVWFFFKNFVGAFFVGMVIRLIIALLFRQDSVSGGGFIRTGLFAAIIWTSLILYMVFQY